MYTKRHPSAVEILGACNSREQRIIVLHVTRKLCSGTHSILLLYACRRRSSFAMNMGLMFIKVYDPHPTNDGPC
eukprot:m.5501 g.5501  ORF g.5501 m.5501 type:complete len:74 (+) comp5020_c0_seq2:440-661(+)